MTRFEAIHRIENFQEDPDGFIDSLIALGLIKVEEPKTATDKALEALNRHIMSSGGKTLTSLYLCNIMDTAGVRIVDK